MRVEMMLKDSPSSELCFSTAALSRVASHRRLAFFMLAVAGFVAGIIMGTPAADAANFNCSWNDSSDNWTTVGDWSNCGGFFPNNGGGNTFNAAIPQGFPTLDTAVTVGSVTVSNPGALNITGGNTESVTGNFSNSGGVSVDGFFFGGGGSSLLIGGTLSNSGQMNIGNTGLGAATTVMAAGLVMPPTCTGVGEQRPVV